MFKLMNRQVIGYLQVGWWLLLVIGCSAQQKKAGIEKSATENTLLWEVKGKGIKLTYIFGTMHLLCAEDAQLSTNLKAVLKNIDKIYMELDMDNMSDMMSAVTKMGMSNGTKLKDLLTPEEYSKVKNFFEKKGGMIPFSMMENFKPMLTASTLMEEEMPCKNGLSGIEMQMMEWNKSNGKKEILGLETIAMQLAVFDSIPYKEQAKMLLDYVDSLPKTLQETDQMVKAYKQQNLKEIIALMAKAEPGLDSHMDILLDNRNKNWVKQIKDIAKSKAAIFAVGAGHLVGKAGLIELLKKEGYILVPLKN